MPTVAELVTDPDLGLVLVAGAQHADREVDAAAVSELAHPGSWLQGGELLLTIGLLLPDTVDGCRAYLNELDAAGVRAVGLGLGAELPHQDAPARLVTAADEIGMPLLTVPDPVPFIAVTKAVFAARARVERQELEWALQTQRALTAAAVTPGGLQGILTAHRDATGRTGVVVDLLGRALAESGTGAASLVATLEPMMASVRDQGLSAAAVDIRGGRRREIHALGARRLRGWLVIDGPADSPAAQQVSGDLVSLLTLELERRLGMNTAQRRGRAQVLDRLSRGIVDDNVAARWLMSIGLSDADVRAAAIDAPDDADDLAADLLLTLPDALVRAAGEVVEVAVPLDTDLAGALRSLAAARPTGIGMAVRPGALAVSLRQARSVLSVSRRQGRHVRADDVASSRVLLGTADTESLRGYSDAVLGPLDAADRAEELVRTVSGFLEHNGHWAATAAALRVHRHTVRNRIDAVERLTGRRMDDASDRFELWLALRAREAARMSAE
ncbi:helix-turn-helix domain-containing protein [Mycolicibacterium litorale]|uniref:Regulatory protein n=1 Tax=Mycolicibacterium litorale TaxID=758802 RepID=A0AAD1MQZ3_9MYCO|nr:PucR family transcriptional regulator [Mycolicibacterium litorale]MCV7414168.1 PucR family transcriptional regulator [Mycolicibacterium litorale]TDY02141.1 purine catabolism regulator [Mycolicibacterium litorale]BBY15644.1 putative regulatory protein [Mycolicibacterium litorale]